MRLRTLLADHLTNLEIAKLANHPGSEDETDEQRVKLAAAVRNVM